MRATQPRILSFCLVLTAFAVGGVGAAGSPPVARGVGKLDQHERTGAAEPCEVARLSPEDGLSGHRAGVSVAMQNDLLAVGDDGTSGEGVDIYERTGNAWTLTDRIDTPYPDDNAQFASRVVLDANRLAVTPSPWSAPPGAVHLYTRGDDQWESEAVFTPPDGATTFGKAIALQGDYLLVGSSIDSAPLAFGSVHVFRQTGIEWVEEGTILPDGVTPDLSYGNAIAYDDPYIAIGANGAEEVYLFQRQGGLWVYQQSLTPSDGGAGDYFGWPLAIRGDTLVVGATRHDEGVVNSGAAYVFAREGDVWVERQKLLPSVQFGDPPFGNFGSDLTVGADRIVVGAPQDGDFGPDSGAAYLFEKIENTWIETQRLLASDGSALARYGRSMAIMGDVIAVGALGEMSSNIRTGATYIVAIGGEDCNGNNLLDACEPDCNANGAADECDVNDQTSLDCNGNLIPDECEDCNENGVADECDILDQTSLDCNSNLTPDECEDCNANGVADECDLIDQTSPDCNDNAVPDECDVAAATSLDCNGNIVPDECEAECNANGVPDDCDIAGGFSADDNENGMPDECERVIYVYKWATTGANDGTNWQDAFRDLQDGLDVAQGGNQIWLARGPVFARYKPDRGTGNRAASFEIPNGVALYGSFVGTEESLDERVVLPERTILSGDITITGDPSDNSYHVVRIADAASTTVLDGLTITGGQSALDGDGAGIRLSNAHPQLRNLILADNRSGDGEGEPDHCGPTASKGNGGAIACLNGSSPIIENSLFRNNRTGDGRSLFGADLTTGGAGGDGGALYVGPTSTVVVRDCSFEDNFTGDPGDGHCAGAPGRGGAIACDGTGGEAATVLIERCDFARNHTPSGAAGTFGGGGSGGSGGALYAVRGDVTIVNSVFEDNWTGGGSGPGEPSGATGGDGGRGGAVHAWIAHLTVESSLFLRNRTGNGASVGDPCCDGAGGRGGAIYSSDPEGLIRNCTFYANETGSPLPAGDNEGVLLGDAVHGGGRVTNSIMWNHLRESVGGTVEVTYSNIEGWPTPGLDGNINDDPLFINPTEDDLRLSVGSTSIDTGDPQSAFNLADADLDGRPRVLCGRVDMGAYEFDAGAAQGDFDCSGVIDVFDFAEWDRCFTGPGDVLVVLGCQAFDFDADNDVDFADFAALQSAFDVP